MDTRVTKSNKCEITNYYNIDHQAIDLVGPNYTIDSVRAHTKGKVVYIQDGLPNLPNSTGNQSYGNFIKIKHPNNYHTLYAHMQKGLKYHLGDTIEAGEILGTMSNSGNANGAHLHFEVWKNNQRIDPYEYLNKDLYKELTKEEIEILAKEVIEGKYGNGQERKNKLGNNYQVIQNRVNEILSKPSKIYLSNKNYKGQSIVDALKEINIDSSYQYRSKLAELNGIKNYSGSANQNIKLLNLLKSSNLLKA